MDDHKTMWVPQLHQYVEAENPLTGRVFDGEITQIDGPGDERAERRYTVTDAISDQKISGIKVTDMRPKARPINFDPMGSKLKAGLNVVPITHGSTFLGFADVTALRLNPGPYPIYRGPQLSGYVEAESKPRCEEHLLVQVKVTSMGNARGRFSYVRLECVDGPPPQWFWELRDFVQFDPEQ